MSLLGDLAGGLLAGATGQQQQASSPAAAVMELLMNHEGGVAGVVEKFAAAGLGEAAQSWLGNGQNLPISAEQIQSVLGSGVVEQLAGKLGVSPEQAGAHLSELLPDLISHVSQNGQAPQQSELVTAGVSLLESFLASRNK